MLLAAVVASCCTGPNSAAAAATPQAQLKDCTVLLDTAASASERFAAAELAIRPWSLGGKGVNDYPAALASSPPGAHSGLGIPQVYRQNFNWIWEKI